MRSVDLEQNYSDGHAVMSAGGRSTVREPVGIGVLSEAPAGNGYWPNWT